MQHPFSTLEPEYVACLSNMKVTRQREIDATARKLVWFSQAGRYKAVSDELGIPQIFIAPSFEREASSNFRLSPAQGDPIDRVSTHVPRGLGPYDSWFAAALEAYRHDGMDKIGRANWTWARLCYEDEAFNGFGPRNHGRHTGYLWAGSNIYNGGKYVADGVWNASAIDSQLGTIPVARAMVLLDPSLDIPGWPGETLPMPTTPMPPPIGHGGVVEDRDTALLQDDLNKLGYGPLVVDNNYGRRTRAAVRAFQKDHKLDVDGLSGPKTYAAILTALKSKEPTVTTTAQTPINPLIVAASSLSHMDFAQWEKSVEQIDGYLGFLSNIPGPVGQAAKVLHEQVNPALEQALSIGAKIQGGDITSAYPDIAALFHTIGNILHPASAVPQKPAA